MKARISLFLGLFLFVGVGLLARSLYVAKAARACIEHLQEIEGAKYAWQLQTGHGVNDQPQWLDIMPYLPWRYGRPPELPKCPRGGTYSIGRVSEKPLCSFWMHDLDLGPVGVRVVTPQWDALAGATVEVLTERGEKLVAQTDANGVATLSIWPRRFKAVTIWKPGFTGATNITLRDWPQTGNFELTPANDSRTRSLQRTELAPSGQPNRRRRPDAPD